MAKAKDQATWDKIIALLEDKLQFGFLEQVRAVADVSFDGSEVTLFVSTDEAMEFFRADVNQQRLSIVSRPVVRIERVEVRRLEAEAIR